MVAKIVEGKSRRVRLRAGPEAKVKDEGAKCLVDVKAVKECIGCTIPRNVLAVVGKEPVVGERV